VKRASAPAVVGVLCTIVNRCLELFCGLCVGNKREWACVLMSVCLSTHLGQTGPDQSFCVFDSNCVMRF
jgi:hypothetical protein